NMKSPEDVRKMRSIAEQAFSIVKEYEGSHSGEHGDGIVRSEFHPIMFGDRMLNIFENVKEIIDPGGLFNPGKIVDPPRMDDRSLFRYGPNYLDGKSPTQLDWSTWGGFAGAVEMCNNNGACRKRDAAVMCPSFRATGDETHSTRGRANTLRLALTGQLGPNAFSSSEMAESMSLCVGCKACKRECPTGVDMARMKLELQASQTAAHGLSIGQRLVAYLPRYAPAVADVGSLFNGVQKLPGAAICIEALTGFTRHRPLPRWHKSKRLNSISRTGPADGQPVVILLDTFSRWFEPSNGEAMVNVLAGAGCRVHIAGADDKRPLCCGRTFLAAGLIDEARHEARRLLKAVKPFIDQGIPLIGLEPSCLLTLRDEYDVLLPPSETKGLKNMAFLLEEYLVQQSADLSLNLGPTQYKQAALHCHCHQKAFATAKDVETVLNWIPDLTVNPITSSCCGMAGDFGQWAKTHDVSMAMAELSLLPALRKVESNSAVVGGGTSCRQQISHGTNHDAVHFVQLLYQSMTHSTAVKPDNTS
ncbi:MAG: FAD-linked oxidase C-terminal domain-containing protein, partial [Pseudomonadota bacterium]|nr:FAD-linked oxidase C-terminal domain-containing protein [Pseudomonadota bacterium]